MGRKMLMYQSGSQQLTALNVGIFEETFQSTEVGAELKEPQGLLRHSGISSIGRHHTCRCKGKSCVTRVCWDVEQWEGPLLPETGPKGPSSSQNSTEAERKWKSPVITSRWPNSTEKHRLKQGSRWFEFTCNS